MISLHARSLAPLAVLLCACSGGASTPIDAPSAPDVPATGEAGADAPPPTAEDEKQNHVLLVEERTGPSAIATIATVRADGSMKTKLASDGLSPSWTPDGRIIFVSERSGSRQIWTMTADGSDARQIGDLPKTMDPVMPQMAKNGLVVFMGNDAHVEPDGNAGIWIMHEDGSGLVELTTGMQPSLAASGTWIAYTLQIDEPFHRQIWRIDTDGKNEQQLTFLGDPDYPDANAPNISPDESTVAFFSGKESDRAVPGAPPQPIFTWGHRNVATVPAAGGARRTLTPCHPVETQAELDATSPATGDCIAADNPAWAPDGHWLVFDVGFEAGTETWMVDTSGSGFQRFYAAGRGTVRVPLRRSEARK
jgi:hypothetical protein